MGANFDLIDVLFSAALSSGGFSGFAPFFGNTHKIVLKAWNDTFFCSRNISLLPHIINRIRVIISCCVYRYIPFSITICFRLTSRDYACVNNYWIQSAELSSKLCRNNAEPNTLTGLTKVCDIHRFVLILSEADTFVFVMWFPGDGCQPCRNKSKAEIREPVWEMNSISTFYW